MMALDQTYRGSPGTRIAKAILAIALSASILTGCNKVEEWTDTDPRPKVEIKGELSVLMSPGRFDPMRGMTGGKRYVIVEYKPDHDAIIYTTPDTKFVGLENSDQGTNYQLGRQYLVRGYETEPIGEKRADGRVFVTAPSGVDRWIEAKQIELLDE